MANIQNLNDVRVGDVCKDMHKHFAKLIEEKKKWDDPLILEVNNIYGSVESCFSLFNFYHREVYYDESIKRHILKIYYYDFDESELVRDILSLGDGVIARIILGKMLLIGLRGHILHSFSINIKELCYYIKNLILRNFGGRYI